MKETGIIMSGNHPKLIQDGIKTMTRRAYGLEKVNQEPDVWEFKRLNNGGIALFWRKNIMEEDIALCKCPYGQVGDRLWVRETLDIGLTTLGYRAGGQVAKQLVAFNKDWFLSQRLDYVPSIFMPRWASRLTLEITGLRAERLQEITSDDARLEGVDFISAPINAFKFLWDSLNAKRGYGWDKNQWVWVIKFDNIGVRVK